MPSDTDLTIITDSATLIWIAVALNQKLFWRDFRHHPQLQAILRFVEDLDRRTGKTTIAKAASHRGCYMNEIADTLAVRAAQETEEIQERYETQYDTDIQIECGAPHPRTLKELIPHRLLTGLALHTKKTFLAPKPTETFRRMDTPNSGRQYLGAALAKLHTKAARRAVQIHTQTFPSQTRLKTWGKEADATCPFCKQAAETTEHFSQWCPTFSDARTAAHDKTWGATWAAIIEHLEGGWEAIHDTTLRDTQLQCAEEWKNHKPDGILLNSKSGTIIIVEFKRSTGHTGQDTEAHHQEKIDKYKDLTENITAENHSQYPKGASLLAFVCTFKGALDEERWQDNIARLPLKPKATKAPAKIMEAAVHAALEAFSDMADLRMALKTQQAQALRTDRT